MAGSKPSAKTGRNRQPGRFRELVTTVSIAANVILASLSGYTGFLATRLDAANKTLEMEIDRAQHTPNVSSFYLIADATDWLQFTESDEPFPFAHDVTSYTTFGNSTFEALERHKSKIQTNSTQGEVVTFLVITNRGNAPAYKVVVTDPDGQRTTLGDLSERHAVLIPLEYKIGFESGVVTEQHFTELEYETRVGKLVETTTTVVPKPSFNPAWTPAFGKLKGFGRAMVRGCDDYRVPNLEREP